jgi:tRNA threonylcarbamoyladenosine biosynthesis protein TsaE
MEVVFGIKDINDVAENFWQRFNRPKVFALEGAMGAGKTTFIHALCEAKGVRGSVSSPTFSLINEYVYDEGGADRIMYHIDLYRLKDEAEAVQAGVEDCLYSGNICFVEWPGIAPGIFPPGTVHITLELTADGQRRLRVL